MAHQIGALMEAGGAVKRRNMFSVWALVFRRAILRRRGRLAETVYIII